MNAKLLGDAAIVHMLNLSSTKEDHQNKLLVTCYLNPGTEKTFQDYADMVFTPYVSSQLDIANRVDVI